MNPTILDVVKKEVTKLLATGIIYPISDSQWVSPVEVVPKKSGMIIMRNQHDELVPMWIQNSWRVCIDYRRLNQDTRKDHYTFACHLACATRQERMEVFMDEFTVYVDSFDACLENLSKVLTRCIDTNLVLNFEKCHFMVIEGIVLGHLVSNRGIEVDKSKIDTITSLPNPTLVRDICSFLGHVGFYRRFIKNFNKIALSLSKLLQKDELKSRLTSAHILQAPDWELPFKLMCDASNSALGAVLGQRAEVGKPMHVIAYASQTMDPTQLNFTTTKKELLAFVFALDKFHLYLLGSKIIVFFDHVVLIFLLNKPDAKPRLI
ncbi:Retrovirus-related Pol polyprotein, partial [Mucuna pruriens]